ncbi:MAG: fdh [Actinoallomurus sp.]|jgi:threonine dehydrogenase-like Zn-dependent dehydrogenase|nr:fdh [Actinoallomurus sp.]
MAKILDLAMPADIFPTGYRGARTAGVTTGSTVYVAGPGPVGPACARMLPAGAAVVIVGGHNPERTDEAIMHDRTQIARNVNATVIPLEKAPEAYREFGRGAAREYALDPHGVLGAA